MDNMDNKNNIFDKLKNSKYGMGIVIAVGFIGILLIFVSSFFSDKKTSQKESTSSLSQTTVTADEYEQKMEDKLTSVISKIEGVSNVNVLVTLEQGESTIYAKQEKQSTEQTKNSDGNSERGQDSTENNYIIVKDSDGNEHALSITQEQPKIKGVVVVCSGAEVPQVKENVFSAVSVAAGVTTTHISILPYN